MKKLIIFTFLISFISINSQSWNSLSIEQRKNSNPKNEVSKFFKKEIPRVLLRNVFYNKNQNNLVLSFFINNENLPYGIRINNFRNRDLNEAIIAAFKKYSLQKLNLKELNQQKLYFFQVVKKDGKKNIINCSNTFFSETLPYKTLCNDLNYYQDIKKCIETDVKKYFYENIDFSLANILESNERIIIDIKLNVNKEGILTSKKVKVPDVFMSNINSIINSYPKFKESAKVNDVSIDYPFYFFVSFKKGEHPKFKEWQKFKKSSFKLNANNDFSRYLAQKLNAQDLKNANLNRIKKNVSLRFEINSRNKPFNISTTARSESLDKKIIDAFEVYPLEKLKFKSRKAFNAYFTDILYFEDNKTSIQTFDEIMHERIPIFPGCENSNSIRAAKQCFSRNIQRHFVEKFDADLPKNLGLSKGRKRVFIGFNISAEGDIVDIKVKALHPRIVQEVTKVMQTVPKIIPGAQNGKNVNIKYSIPFTIIVD